MPFTSVRGMTRRALIFATRRIARTFASVTNLRECKQRLWPQTVKYCGSKVVLLRHTTIAVVAEKLMLRPHWIRIPMHHTCGSTTMNFAAEHPTSGMPTSAKPISRVLYKNRQIRLRLTRDRIRGEYKCY